MFSILNDIDAQNEQYCARVKRGFLFGTGCLFGQRFLLSGGIRWAGLGSEDRRRAVGVVFEGNFYKMGASSSFS
jgi:hypothetical protein